MFKKYFSKKVVSWALYDWANSSFSTTIMAGFFPLFFKKYWSEGADATLTTTRLGSTISISSLILALLSPTLGALADQKGIKKQLTFGFMIFGIIGCMSMSVIPSGDWLIACIAYGVAMMGFNASSVFYDSLLPSVAPGPAANFASSLGFGLGYLGGGILFAINVGMYLFPKAFFIPDGTTAIKLSFLSVGIWWFAFSLPLFKNVPEPEFTSKNRNLLQATFDSINELKATFLKLVHEKNTLIFLAAFWLYIDGVYTVMTMAVDFGMSIGLNPEHLIASLLIVQFVGFPAALVFAKMANSWGCRRPILICLVVYSIGVFAATKMITVTHFYGLALMIGLVQGGVQALSRSLYSRMIPPAASGEYFGLFNLVGKFASIFGPLVVGWGVYFTNEPRSGMLGLLVLFLLGGFLLWQVKEPDLTAGNTPT